MAVSSKRSFVLAIPLESSVDPSLVDHLAQHGGKVIRDEIRDYSVYFGATDSKDGELDGWVFGDNEGWTDVVNCLTPDLMRHLRVGTVISGGDLDVLERQIRASHIQNQNVDGEPFHEAIIHLISLAREHEGKLFIQ